MIFAILSRFLSKENTINNNKVFIFFIFAPVLVAVFPFEPLFLYNLLFFFLLVHAACQWSPSVKLALRKWILESTFVPPPLPPTPEAK